jgi:tetratricopeptide (TPR) repeat protein
LEAVWTQLATQINDSREIVFLSLMAVMVLSLLWFERKSRSRQAEVRQVWYPMRPIAGPRLSPGAEAAASAVVDAITAENWPLAHQLLRLTELEGPSPWHTFHLGLVLHRQGYLDDAEWCYRNTLDHAPDHRDAAYNLGILLQETERPTAAIGAYRQALEVFPEDADVLFNLGHIYFQLRMYQQAYRCWLSAAKLDPGARDTRNNLKLLRGMRQALKAAPISA